MSERPKRADWPIITGVVAPVLLAAALYVWGYFALSDAEFYRKLDMHLYDYNWQASIYTPAASVESVVRGRHFGTMAREEYDNPRR